MGDALRVPSSGPGTYDRNTLPFHRIVRDASLVLRLHYAEPIGNTDRPLSKKPTNGYRCFVRLIMDRWQRVGRRNNDKLRRWGETRDNGVWGSVQARRRPSKRRLLFVRRPTDRKKREKLAVGKTFRTDDVTLSAATNAVAASTTGFATHRRTARWTHNEVTIYSCSRDAPGMGARIGTVRGIVAWRPSLTHGRLGHAHRGTVQEIDQHILNAGQRTEHGVAPLRRGVGGDQPHRHVRSTFQCHLSQRGKATPADLVEFP